MVFLAGALIYTLAVFGSYSDSLKASPYYFLVGATLGALANMGWFYLAKTSASPSQIMINGFYWDAMIVACYLFIPLMFFAIKLTPGQIIGIVLIISGIGASKL